MNRPITACRRNLAPCSCPLRSHAESFLRDRASTTAVATDARFFRWLANPLDGIHSFDRIPAEERRRATGNLVKPVSLTDLKTRIDAVLTGTAPR